MENHNPLLPDPDPSLFREVLVREVVLGGTIQTGYGYAYHEYNRDVIIVVPVPFNLLVQLARWLYYSTMHQSVLNEMDKVENAAYIRGYDEGRRMSTASWQMRMDKVTHDAYNRGRSDAIKDLLADLNRKRDAKRQGS